MGYGLQNGFSASVMNSKGGRTTSVQMVCRRSRGRRSGKVQGDCKFQVVVNFDKQGNVLSVKALLEHSHDLDITARPMDFLPK